MRAFPLLPVSLVTTILSSLAHGDVTVRIKTSTVKVDSGDHLACVTMDWWPDNKCNYGVCPWTGSGITVAPINDTRLVAALRGLGPVTLRIGGTQADNITYAVGADAQGPCPPFSPAEADSNNFTGGCLTSSRWDEINAFCPGEAEGCRLVFGVNAMNGRDRKSAFFYEPCPGSWNSTNARSLIQASADAGYPIFGFELGNEIECLSPEDFAADIRSLGALIAEAYPDAETRPKLIATDQISWQPYFFQQLLPLVSDILDVVTWHDYPLGPGYGNEDLEDDIMTASFHDSFISTAAGASALVDSLTPAGRSIETWMGETGGCYNSGHNETSNRFMDVFWYLESMAGFAASGHLGFCRQTLLGGNYELVDKTSLLPNPDYYALRAFNLLMGSEVLETQASDSDQLRAWAHCAKGHSNSTPALSLLLLNYGPSDLAVTLDVAAAADIERQDYVFTAESLHSSSVNLNGVPLDVGPEGDIPALVPQTTQGNITSLTIPNQSYAFYIIPLDASASPVCA